MSSSKHQFQGSSPRSSAGSATGTPETRITVFSPLSSGDQLGKPISENADSIISPSAVTISAHEANIMDSLDKDPFISQGKCEQKLSPTASAFQPFALRISEGAGYSPIVVQSSGFANSPGQELANIDAASLAGSRASSITQQGAFSTDTGVTRALKVSDIRTAVQVDILNNLVLTHHKVGISSAEILFPITYFFVLLEGFLPPRSFSSIFHLVFLS
jgi:hypothetical protein